MLVRLERCEIEAAVLGISDRGRLMTLPGIPRHRDVTPEEHQGLSACRIPIDAHLRRLGVLDDSGTLRKRAVAMSNRNLGTNHGNVAWQRGETPPRFHIREDRGLPSHTCLTAWRSGGVSIENLRFDRTAARVLDAGDGRDLGDEIEWATFGQRVLQRRRVTRVEDIAEQFYDIRRILAFDHHRMQGDEIRHMIYRDYPRGFKDHVLSAWREVECRELATSTTRSGPRRRDHRAATGGHGRRDWRLAQSRRRRRWIILDNGGSSGAGCGGQTSMLAAQSRQPSTTVPTARQQSPSSSRAR